MGISNRNIMAKQLRLTGLAFIPPLSFAMGFCSLPSRPSHVGQLGEDRPVEIGKGLMIMITKSLSKMLKKTMKITFYLFKI